MQCPRVNLRARRIVRGLRTTAKTQIHPTAKRSVSTSKPIQIGPSGAGEAGVAVDLVLGVAASGFQYIRRPPEVKNARHPRVSQVRPNSAGPRTWMKGFVISGEGELLRLFILQPLKQHKAVYTHPSIPSQSQSNHLKQVTCGGSLGQDFYPLLWRLSLYRNLDTTGVFNQRSDCSNVDFPLGTSTRFNIRALSHLISRFCDDCSTQ